jgi:probable HAF family extracellular repeat protein
MSRDDRVELLRRTGAVKRPAQACKSSALALKQVAPALSLGIGGILDFIPHGPRRIGTGPGNREGEEPPFGQRGFVWQKGVMTLLGTLGGRYSRAFGINSAGDIVGTSETAEGEVHAVRWTRK